LTSVGDFKGMRQVSTALAEYEGGTKFRSNALATKSKAKVKRLGIIN
jgi:hypothetical protein